MSTQIRRTRPVVVSYGRGSDSTRKSAVYGVFCSGTSWEVKPKATIFNESSGRYMEPVSWVVEFTERTALGRFKRSYHSTFGLAKAWALIHVC